MADVPETANSGRAAQELVRLALLEFRPGALVSTGFTIARVREYDPGCPASDEELVNMVIAAARGRSMTIEFDHNGETAA